MFLEPYYIGQRKGWIEVISGCMFSGKTEELIRRLKRAQIAGLNVRIYKSGKDTRYHEENVVSHDETSLVAIPVEHSSRLLDSVEDVDVVGVDEAQFFDDDLPRVVDQLANRGVRVILAGLDMDFQGKPFSPIPEIMAMAEFITKVHAICIHCGNLASHSYRVTQDTERIFIGEKNEYEPRCRSCFHAGPLLSFKPQIKNRSDDSMKQKSLFDENE